MPLIVSEEKIGFYLNVCDLLHSLLTWTWLGIHVSCVWYIIIYM